MPRPSAFALALAFPLAACTHDVSQDPATGLLAEASEHEPVIVGAVDWTEVTELPDSSLERERSRSVGYLSIPARGTRCTAFLVSEDIVMTNEHCVSRARDARGAEVYFRYEQGVPFSQWAAYPCEELIGNDAALDFALLRCQGRPGAAFGVLGLEARGATTGEAAYVIHQNCDFYRSPSCSPTKKLSPGRVVRATTTAVRHDADTLGGSSGSPLFAASSHRVIALHNLGLGGNRSGRGSANSSVPMTRILPTIAQRWPDLVLGPASDGAQAPSQSAPAVDALEPNDSIPAASALPVPAAVDDLLIGPSDVDVFRLELPAPARLRVSLRFSHTGGDLDAALYGAADTSTPLASGTSSNDDEDFTADVAAGTYFLAVYGFEGATNTYGLLIDTVQAGDAAPGEPGQEDPAQLVPADDAPNLEPNDTPAAAAAVELPFASTVLAIDGAGEEDWFVFETSAGGRTVELGFTHAVGDLDLYLYDGQGALVAESASVTDDERIEAALGAGRYLLRIVGYEGATGAYSLRIE